MAALRSKRRQRRREIDLVAFVLSSLWLHRRGNSRVLARQGTWKEPLWHRRWKLRVTHLAGELKIDFIYEGIVVNNVLL